MRSESTGCAGIVTISQKRNDRLEEPVEAHISKADTEKPTTDCSGTQPLPVPVPEFRNSRRAFLAYALMAGLVPHQRVVEVVLRDIEQEAAR